MSTKKNMKPLIKWVGGKTQLINKLIPKFPREFNNYHEVFLGGGSVLIALLESIKNDEINISGRVYAYDFNKILIHLYKNIQTRHEELYRKINVHKDIYRALTGVDVNRKPQNITEAKTSKESYYYWCRKVFNEIQDKTSIECSALFLFLNKTCFRGVYREGPNGFNVPYGHYKKTPEIVNEKHLKDFKELIKDVHFECLDFTDTFPRFSEGDFIYLDPPYAPKKEGSFVGYNKKGFNLTHHESLFNLTKSLKEQNITFIMSNAEVKLVTDAFTDYNTIVVEAKRTINSKNPGSKTNEVIIYNLNL